LLRCAAHVVLHADAAMLHTRAPRAAPCGAAAGAATRTHASPTVASPRRTAAARPPPACTAPLRCVRTSAQARSAGAGGGGAGSGGRRRTGGKRAPSPRKPASSSGAASSASGAGWPYETLMLLWDDAFVACMRDGARSDELRVTAQEGYSETGRGAVLCSVTLETTAARAPSAPKKGFGAAAAAAAAASSRAKPSDYAGSDDAPPFRIVTCDISFLPRTMLLSLASSAAAGVPPPPALAPGTLPYAALRGADLSRLLALTASLGAPDAGAAAGEEAPYDPDQGELVVLFAATVDGAAGAPVLGADVLALSPTGRLHTRGLPDEDEE
jgi:hypothetical protein